MEQYTSNMVIHCPTKEMAKFLLRRMYERGIRWFGGESMFDHHWEIYGDQTCYRVNPDKRLAYANVEYYDEENFVITEFSDLFPGKNGFRSEDIISSLPNIPQTVLSNCFGNAALDRDELFGTAEWEDITNMYWLWQNAIRVACEED